MNDRTVALWTISDLLREYRRQRFKWAAWCGMPLDISMREWWDSQ